MRVVCEAVRYFEEPQPGAIEAYLTDASGFRWQIVDKIVMFHEWRDIWPTAMPMPVSVECRIVTDDGGPTVTISIPWVSAGPYEVERSALIVD